MHTEWKRKAPGQQLDVAVLSRRRKKRAVAVKVLWRGTGCGSSQKYATKLQNVQGCKQPEKWRRMPRKRTGAEAAKGKVHRRRVGVYGSSQRESGRQTGIQKLTRLSLYYSWKVKSAQQLLEQWKQREDDAPPAAVAEGEEMGKSSFWIVEMTSGKWCDVGRVDEN